MTQQNQIIAVEKGIKAQAQRTLTDAYHTIQKSDPLFGITKTYQPKDEDGDKLPTEAKMVQVNLHTVIEGVTDSLTRLFDVTFTKDHTNTLAHADVKVGDITLVENAPVPFLLFLEKQLVDLRTFVSTLPFLDPAEQWTPDDLTGAYRTPPIETTRTKKVPKNHVKAEATKEHPAQVEIFTEDVIVGTWTTVKFSGALPAMTLAGMLNRVDQLAEAIKMAREQANTHLVEDQKCGEAILSYIFGEDA